MNWLGDFPEDFTTVVCMFTTHDADGAPVAPSTAFESADVDIYKNGGGTAKATTNGVTMTSPFASTTGLHAVVIDTSNDTGDAGWWVTGALYTLVLTPDETVGGFAVAKVIGQFGIELAETLRPTTNGRQLDVSTGGEAGLDWANVGSPTTTVGLSGTTVKTATDVETDTADIQSRLPAALSAGGMMKSDVEEWIAVAVATPTTGGVPEVDVTYLGGVLQAAAQGNAFARFFVAMTIGTADSGTTTTMVDAALTTADTDYYKGAWIWFTSGTIAGQGRLITGFTPASDTVTFAPALTQAVTTQNYVIVPAGGADVVAMSGDATAADNAEAFFDGTGYAGTGNVIPSVTTVTGNVNGSVGSVTGAVGSVTGAVGSVTGNIGGTLAGFTAAAKAEIESEMNDALIVHRLDELLNADSDIDGLAPPTVGSVFHELMSKTAGSFTFDQTTDSNEALRDRGDVAWITATGFSTHSAADVWASAARTLTAGTNIVLAKGTGITGFTDISAAAVNAEMVDVLATDTYAEASAALAATSSLKDRLVWISTLARNRVTQTATVQTLRNDANSADIATATVSDDGVTFTRAEWA